MFDISDILWFISALFARKFFMDNVKVNLNVKKMYKKTNSWLNKLVEELAALVLLLIVAFLVLRLAKTYPALAGIVLLIIIAGALIKEFQRHELKLCEPYSGLKPC